MKSQPNPRISRNWKCSPSHSRYQESELLGRGEGGHVYLGLDSHLGRQVAIKRVKPSRQSHFQAELDAMSRLNHPNIGQIFDRGSDPDGPFLVLEYLEGQNLSQLIQHQGPLENHELGRIASQILDALVSIHETNLMHLDIKPGNIMVSYSTGSSRYTLIDFGNARPFPTSPRNRMQPTMPSSKSALPYASPEQLMEGDLDQRSDLYSLGILLYEAATGRKPYMGHSPYQILASLQNHPHMPLNAIRKDLPKPFCDWIESLFAPTPSDRPNSAIEALAAFRTL